MNHASKTADNTQNIARKARHSTKGFLKTLERLHQKEPHLNYKKHRVIARIRTHNGKIYEEWIPVFDRGLAWTHTFHRGGVLTFRPKEVPVARLEEIEKEMGNCQWLKYKIRKVFEPRVHVLFSDHKGTGYKYGNLKMKAHDIAQLPKIHEFAKERAMDHQIRKWNIGADLVCYRDGQDGIGWHRDSSQGENIVESLIVSSPEEVRSLCIQALGDPQKGDEQLELFPNAGDIYSMDGSMQKEYVHSVLKECSVTSKRLILVLRHGDIFAVSEDSGCRIGKLESKTAKPYIFGVLPDRLQEGKLYGRQELHRIGAHSSMFKGVSGKADVGANAIIVKYVNEAQGEVDDLVNITYFADSRLGGRAMFTSYCQQRPLRVFRASGGNSQYCPQKEGSCEAAYRYDGIYRVVRASDLDGNHLLTTANPTTASLFDLNRIEPHLDSEISLLPDTQTSQVPFYELKHKWRAVPNIRSKNIGES